ncbi:MAG: SIS domain-containing protein [Chloroflexota bacterium]|nr:SIS domain-containing protein [Chloroflexota bacterium]
MAWQETVQQYFREMGRIDASFPQDKVRQAVDVLYQTWKDGRTVFTMGNGGSASTASHFASDLAKFTIVPGKARFKVFSLNDNTPLVSAWTNDSGFGSIFAEQMEPWVREGDVVVGFSVHGGSGTGEAGPWSQNLVRAMALAKERKGKVIGFSGFDGGAMKKMADVCLVVPVSSEPFGTPIVEAYHVVLHHLICLTLKERIMAEG